MSTPDFFRSRLDTMIDLRHPLAVLATRMPWASIEATLTPMFARRAREGRVLEGVDLFGATAVLGRRRRERGGSPSIADSLDGRAAVFEARLQRERRVGVRAGM